MDSACAADMIWHLGIVSMVQSVVASATDAAHSLILLFLSQSPRQCEHAVTAGVATVGDQVDAPSITVLRQWLFLRHCEHVAMAGVAAAGGQDSARSITAWRQCLSWWDQLGRTTSRG